MKNPLLRRLTAAFFLACLVAPAVVMVAGCEDEEEVEVVPPVQVD